MSMFGNIYKCMFVCVFVYIQIHTCVCVCVHIHKRVKMHRRLKYGKLEMA